MNQLQAVTINEGVLYKKRRGEKWNGSNYIIVGSVGESAAGRSVGGVGPHHPMIAELTQAIEE